MSSDAESGPRDPTAVRHLTTRVDGLTIFYREAGDPRNPRWQAYLRERQPPTLVEWGKHDLSFTVAGAVAFGEDVPDAEVHSPSAGGDHRPSCSRPGDWIDAAPIGSDCSSTRPLLRRTSSCAARA